MVGSKGKGVKRQEWGVKRLESGVGKRVKNKMAGIGSGE